MSSPVQGITGQVAVIYQKAIAEIEQEETEIEKQISKLVEKKAALNQKREHIDDLRTQVDVVTEDIDAAEALYQAELKNKSELDAEIEQITQTLERLKADAESNEAKLSETNGLRRSKYQSLGNIIEQFGESVTGKLSDEVIAGLQETIREPELDEDVEEASDSLDLNDVSPDAALELSAQSSQTEDSDPEVDAPEPTKHPLTEEEDTVLDDATSRMSAALGLDAPEEDDISALLNSVTADSDEVNTAPAGIRAAPRKASIEAERLRHALESKQSEVDGVEDGTADASTEDGTKMSEFDKLLADAEADTKRGVTDFDADALRALDLEDDEPLTPKTAKTPRKRRSLLTSYLTSKDQ